MKKLFKEFKEFISRGSVIDLAVGMIIGAAFTAIVTAVVNYVLKPIIALIPLGSDGTFKTILKPEVKEIVDGVEVIKQAEVAIVWSEVISAIITFLLTALILFIIIKLINTARNAAQNAKAKLGEGKLTKEQKAELKAAGIDKKDKEAVKKYFEEKAAKEAAEAPVEEPQPTQEELLASILEELKKQNAKK